MLALALVISVLLSTLTLTVSANAPADTPVQYDHFIIYQGENGDAVCREATLEEARELDRINPIGLTPINHLDESPKPRLGAQAEPGHLTIMLEGTAGLNANEAAKAALKRAAAQWESRIHSPVTIYLDVDYGPSNFDTTFPQGVLASTSSLSLVPVNYNFVRDNLISVADTAAKLAVYNALPADSVPIDRDTGSTTTMAVSSSIARAIGLLNPTAQPSDQRARIGFNSNINYDFDPSNGIFGIDFESVAMHEIGHALGFTSRSGGTTNLPAMWDLFRFRSGTTSATFTTAQRIMTVGGPTINSQYFFFPGETEVGLSDGGPSPPSSPPFPNNSDGNQSSHWKQQNLNGGVYIGIMDPRMPSGIQRTITQIDMNALAVFGYNTTGAGLELLLDPSGPAADQASAVDSIFLLRDPFLVVNTGNVLRNPSDPNTRVVIFVRNLPNVPASSVVVSLFDSNNIAHDVTAQDVRAVPNHDFSQVTFRLPSNLGAGTCRVRVVSQSLFTNTATFRIQP